MSAKNYRGGTEKGKYVLFFNGINDMIKTVMASLLVDVRFLFGYFLVLVPQVDEIKNQKWFSNAFFRT